MKKNNVLITGGAGYLGSILTELLLDEGYKVTVLDNLIYKQTSLLHLCSNTNFKFIKGDVIDLNLLKKLIPEYNIIIPLAAIVGAPACDSNTDLAIRVNYTQIQVIVDILRKDQKLIMGFV